MNKLLFLLLFIPGLCFAEIHPGSIVDVRCAGDVYIKANPLIFKNWQMGFYTLETKDKKEVFVPVSQCFIVEE